MYVEAQGAASDANISALAAELSDDATLETPRATESGKAAVIEALRNPDNARLFAGVTWSDPSSDGETVKLSGRLPPGGQIGGFNLAFRFNAAGRISRIEQTMIPAPPPPVTEVKLSDEIKEAVNGALANGTPIVVSYVDENGQPNLSFRGSTQGFSDDQLAIWVRNPEGGLLRALDKNPRMSLLYRDPKTRHTYNFQGRAWIDDDAAVRQRVYDSSPEVERNADRQMRGMSIVIDLDRVTGFGFGVRVNMQRRAAKGS